MTEREQDRTLPPDESEEQVQSGPVTHGGEGDPLGEGVAEKADSAAATDDDGDQGDVGSPRPPA